MPNRQTQATHKDSEPLKPSKSNQNLNQHGLYSNRISFLLNVPSETLTGVTSYLDPPSLLSVAKVNKLLHEHIKNDNTWHRAFVCQILGIGPECDINDTAKTLMLRRSENSWRNEFSVRYRLKRRWERSRNTTVTHIPVHSPISGTYIMPGHSLLSSSLQYGIVARSYPLTGKILSGFLDASGTRTGLGIGNPNAEFTPNVSVCALASDGGTAKVIWGYRNGEVAVATASRAMDASRRTAAELIRCTINDQHEGAVLDASWDNGLNTAIVTAGADGLVKVWDAKRVRCLWTSEKNPKTLVPDACVKVSAALYSGYIVGVMRSGDVVVWSGLDLQSPDASIATSAHEVRIPNVTIAAKKNNEQYGTYDAIFLHVDIHASPATVLVAYSDDPFFYRLRIEGETGNVEITSFGDPSFGPIATLSPFFSAGSSFVLVGDHMGSVSLYDWHAPHDPSGTTVHPTRNFEAHEDGSSVTALAWNGVTLITGSARGTVEVWDALTFEHLRSFVSPVPRIRGRGAAAQGGERDREAAVTQILIGPEKEVLVVSVGDRILAWKAGPVVGGGGGVRSRHSVGNPGKKNKDKGTAKYLKQLEMHQTITESRSLLKLEAEQVKRKNGREQAQRARLESMGLDETEAIDYLLMLSRDEAMQGDNRLSPTSPSMAYDSPGAEEGVFEGDFDDIPSSASFASSSQIKLPMAATGHSGRGTPSQGWQIPVSRSNQNVQTSLRYNSGVLAGSTSPQSGLSKDTRVFPINASTSPTPSNSSIRTDATRRSNASGSGGSASPRSAQSAWNAPLSQSVASASRLPPTQRAAAPPPPALQTASPRGSTVLEDMDEGMRFAIELSLAEARSRGEDV